MLGNMGVWWKERYGEWKTVHNTRIYIYQENTKTGARRCRRVSGGLQPVNKRWLDGGEWEMKRPPPPSPYAPRAGRS